MKNRVLSTLINFGAMAALLILPYLAFAQDSPPIIQNRQGPLEKLKMVGDERGPFAEVDAEGQTIFTVVGIIINIVLSFLALIFLGLTIYAGIGWMTAGGNEESVTKAKSTLTQAIMGLVIVVASWGIWEIIVNLWLEQIGQF